MSFSTPDLCDEFPDQVSVVEPLFNSYGGISTFGGEVVTIKCREDNSLVKETASKPGKGKVMVVDGGGSLRRALLGDLIAKDAVKNGWEGFIIFGCIRDVDVIGQLEIGVKALDTIPLKTEKKGIGELNIPVTFGGVTFHPGDFVYADNNGVVVTKEPLRINN
ncbi:MAG: ribonuclease E activity regulator RraA [Thermodesulfobacteriota bacterium]